MTRMCCKVPVFTLACWEFVNEIKAIDDINYTNTIKHSELSIYDVFQFVDLPYFHKGFI